VAVEKSVVWRSGMLLPRDCGSVRDRMGLLGGGSEGQWRGSAGGVGVIEPRVGYSARRNAPAREVRATAAGDGR